MIHGERIFFLLPAKPVLVLDGVTDRPPVEELGSALDFAQRYRQHELLRHLHRGWLAEEAVVRALGPRGAQPNHRRHAAVGRR